MLPRPVVVGIAVIVSLAWAANVVIGFMDPSRRDPELNKIFGVIVGATFVLSASKAEAVGNLRQKIAGLLDPARKKNGNGEEDRQ